MSTMMDGIMGGGLMGWGVGLLGLLVTVLAILGIVALVKYLFTNGGRG
jgi:hypothetical protein